MNYLKILNLFIFVLILFILAISVALISDGNIFEGVVLLIASFSLGLIEYFKEKELKNILNENKIINKEGKFENGYYNNNNNNWYFTKYDSHCDRQTELNKKKEYIYKILQIDKYQFDIINDFILEQINNKNIIVDLNDPFYKIIKGEIHYNNEQKEQNLNDFIKILTSPKYDKDKIKNKLGNNLYQELVKNIKIDNPVLIYSIIYICARQNEINEYKKETFDFLSKEDKFKLLSKDIVLEYLKNKLN